MAWFLLWSALSTVGPYIDRCVPFQIVSNQLNLPQVDSKWWRLMVEKLTLISLATALLDIPAVSMPIARSLNLRHLWHKTALFRVAIYCPKLKVHLCNDNAVWSAYWYATPVRWMDYLGKVEMLTNRDVNKFVHNIPFVHLEYFWDLFYFSSVGPTLHVAYRFWWYLTYLCSILLQPRLVLNPCRWPLLWRHLCLCRLGKPGSLTWP